MKRRALLTGLLALPFAALGAKAAHGMVAGEGTMGTRLLPHQKQALYGLYYGMGARRIAEAYDISPDEAADMLCEFRRTQAGLQVWARQVHKATELNMR